MSNISQKLDHTYNLIVKMLRIRTFMMLCMFLLIFYVAMNGEHYTYLILIQLLTLAAWYINATCLNDIADYEIDKINLKGYAERPLANDLISRRQLIILAVVSALVALGLSVFLGKMAFFASGTALFLNYLYSMPPVRISYKGVLAPLMLPLGYVALPWVLVYSQNALSMREPQSLILLVGFYCGFVGRIVLKDLRDIKGDAKFGKKTFIVRHGRTPTVIFSGVFWAIGSVFLGYYCATVGAFSEVILITGITIFVWYLLYKIHLETDVKKQIRLVAALGRSANTACILVLLAITVDMTTSALLSAEVAHVFFAISVALFGLASARNLYQETGSQVAN